MRLILASQSPRRRDLLTEAGLDFEVLPPSDGAETEAKVGELPHELVERLAREKAADVANRVNDGLIIGCDTVAVCDGLILGKPRDQADARRMLKTMRGKLHQVLSGLCLWRVTDDHIVEGVESTRLVMDPLSDRQIDAYLRTDAWQGKAGAFGYQDGLDWVHIEEGEASNVVGLPLKLMRSLLKQLPG